MITIHQRYRQTDRQTTCDHNTALCTKVHRAVKTKPYDYLDIYPDICIVHYYLFWAYLVYVMCLHVIGCTVDQPSIRMHHSRPFLRDCQNVLQYQWDRSKPFQPVWDRVFVIYFILCCEELFRFHHDISCKTVSVRGTFFQVDDVHRICN